MGIDYETALKYLSKENAYQVEFGTKGSGISESKKNKILEMDLPGIDFVLGQKRTYSQGSFASYIIGYAKTRQSEDGTTGNIVGELGIEAYYNEELSGTDGSLTYQTDAYGYTLPSAEVVEEKAIDGHDIYLTIDSNIQRFAETLVSNLTKEYEMKWMVFSVMDANTGAILASSTYPNFDPNKLNITEYMNPLVSYQYEPGSTMKIFSWASSIESGLYDGEKKFDSGSIEVDEETKISDWFNTGWGKISFDTGFVYSSNVGATLLAWDLKVNGLTSYYEKLGFGKKTGIELANEVSGIINFKYKSELATAAFGQGITVTPIQMLQALTVLTNDGTLLKPYVVEKIVSDDGEIVYQGGREEIEKVYSKETTDYMKELMYDVVYDGTSKYWKPDKTTMIGKTGTAQIASPSGGYLEGDSNYIRSFAGIFPKEDPQYIVYIAVQQMNVSSAKPIADELTKVVDDIVSYSGLAVEDKEIDAKLIKLDNYISADVTTTVEDLKNKKLNVYVLGSGKYITNQYPLKGSTVQEGSKIFLVTNNDEYILEDMTNWSLNEVYTYANLLGIKINTNGYGNVVSQSIEKGTAITKDIVITVELVKKEELEEVIEEE